MGVARAWDSQISHTAVTLNDGNGADLKIKRQVVEAFHFHLSLAPPSPCDYKSEMLLVTTTTTFIDKMNYCLIFPDDCM